MARAAENPGKENSQVEFYELRSYEMAFRGSKAGLMNFLNETWRPILEKESVEYFYIFNELGAAEPSKLWTLTAYKNLEQFDRIFNLQKDEEIIKASEEYASLGKTYSRYSSFLLRAFQGMPAMSALVEDKSLFELRIYEGENEDAVRRKVMMFDKEEIKLFQEVGLDAVFFGNMMIGPHMPSLVYMLAFDDMDNRGSAWSRFLAHPDWDRMKNLPIYANTVSNIRKIFLEKTS